MYYNNSTFNQSNIYDLHSKMSLALSQLKYVQKRLLYPPPPSPVQISWHDKYWHINCQNFPTWTKAFL